MSAIPNSWAKYWITEVFPTPVSPTKRTGSQDATAEATLSNNKTECLQIIQFLILLGLFGPELRIFFFPNDTLYEQTFVYFLFFDLNPYSCWDMLDQSSILFHRYETRVCTYAKNTHPVKDENSKTKIFMQLTE